MANQQNSYTGSQGTGTNNADFSFTFPSFTTSEVKVEVDNVVKTLTTHYTVENYNTTSGGKVRFTAGNIPTGTTPVRIFRQTDVDSAKATFTAGSSLKAAEINDNFKQVRHALQEAIGAATTDRKVQRFNIEADSIDGTLIADDSINSEHYVDGSIDTAHLADDAITQAKIANDALTGSNMAAGTITTTKLADGLITTAKIADSNVTTAKIADANVTTAKIADSNVTTAKIATDAVTSAKIADGQVNSEHIANGGIDAIHLSANSVETSKIENGAVTTAKIADANVTTAKIADANVTTAKIANDAITSDKIANDALTGANMAAETITTAKLADSAITTGKIATDSITNALIADNQIDSEHYVDGSIDTAHIGNSQVTDAKLASNAVTTAKIAYHAVETNKIDDAAVTTSKIAADAVTNAKIADNSIDSGKITNGAVDTVHIADLNITEGKIAAGAVTTAKISSAQVTDAKLASNSVTTSKITDANVTTVKIADSNVTLAKLASDLKQTSISNSDTQLPTSGAVVDYVAAQIAPIGGLEVIANDASFPNSQPQAGVVISIADAGGLVVNSSGTSTTARTLGGSTVTINNINSSYNSSTVTDGVGFLVSSTGSGQIYNFHKSVIRDQDILSISTDINDFANRYRVASSAPTSSKDDGDLWFDTANGKMMVYNANNTAWEEVSAIGSFNINTLASSGNTGGGSATFNGSAYRFTLSNPPQDAQQLLVSINGVIQKPNTGTSQPSEGFAISGSDIIFSAAPASGSSSFIITLGQSVQIGTPSDGAVSTAKLASSAVTTAKIADNAITGAKIADNLDLPDNNKIRFGTGNDLKIYHDGTNSIISNSTGRLELQGGELRLVSSGGAENILKGFENGAVELYYNGSKKLETTSAGVSVTGEVSTTGHIRLPDNMSLIAGTGSDLFIYHDGSNSIIEDTGAGQLRLCGDNAVVLRKSPTGDVYALGNADGNFELFYDNSKKLETSSGGITVTGNVYVTGHFRGDDNSKLDLGNGNDLQIYHTGSSSYISNSTGTLYTLSDTYEIRGSNGNETHLKTVDNGAVELYYNGTRKLETQSYGVKFDQDTKHLDNGKAYFGTDGDLQIYHDGSNSYIQDAGTGHLYFGSSGYRFNNQAQTESIIQANENGAVELYYDNSKKFETTSAGASVTGTFTASSTVNAGGHFKTNSDWNGFYSGAGDDLQIYHDGTQSIIATNSSATKPLHIKGDPIHFFKAGTSEYMCKMSADSSVQLYHDNGLKFQTTSTGADILSSGSWHGLLVKHSNGNVVAKLQNKGSGDEGYFALYGAGGDSGGASPTIQMDGEHGRIIASSIRLDQNNAANELDDYEEGTFTPAYFCVNANITASYTNQDGVYTKIGNLVYFQIYIRLSSKSGGSGQLRVNNLPFTSSGATGAAYGGGVIAYTYNWDGDKLDRLMVGSSSSQLQLFCGTSSGTNSNAGAGNLNNDTQIRVFGHYRV